MHTRRARISPTAALRLFVLIAVLIVLSLLPDSTSAPPTTGDTEPVETTQANSEACPKPFYMSVTKSGTLICSPKPLKHGQAALTPP